MQFLKYISISVFFLGLLSCKEVKTIEKTNVYDIIPPETTYIFKINNDSVLHHNRVVLLNNFVNKSCQEYLNGLHFKTPFTINVLENNTKIKGFIAIGKTAQIDSIFNGKKDTYEGQQIFEETINKQQYYATQIKGKTLVSNQKLFIENCIRQKDNLNILGQENVFKLGINTLDDNADVNLIVHLPKLQDDIFYQTQLPVACNKWSDWEFYDLMDDHKQVYSGMSMAKDSLQMFISTFTDLQTTNNTNKQFIPYTATEIISFAFSDYPDFFNKHTSFFKNNIALNDKLLGLTEVSYFTDNSNQGIVLSTENIDAFLGEEPIKVMSIADINIYKCIDSTLIDQHFSNLFPKIKTPFFTVLDEHIILTENKSFLQRIINDYQNGSTITNEYSFKKLSAEIPENFNIEILKTRLNIAGDKFISARSYSSENHNVFVNFVLIPIEKSRKNSLVEQVLSYELKDTPKNKPQLVFNHKTKQYNIIYQNENKEVVLIDMKGKTLWKTKVKGWIVGKIQQIDLLRNRKLQYTFVTEHNWYIIDRLGRVVENYPEHYMQKITKGISVFDYDNNRKYRFGITQSNKFRLYNSKAEKVKGFKVKTKSDIIKTPQHFRIGNKDFIVMQDSKGQLYILNRRGETRIKTKKMFNTTNNNWGVYNQKFVNIDNENNLISIDLKGKVKSAKMDLGSHILSRIELQTLAAISNNKLLINKTLKTIDLGNYSRPFIVQNKKNKYILSSNLDNQKIYAFDYQGKLLPKFPVIGQNILDVKKDRSNTYILAYYNQQNIIVYKF